MANGVLGTFQVTGDKLMVTDPCYERGTWCQGMVENALSGTWKGNARYGGEEGDARVSAVEARHESFRESSGGWRKAAFEVGVDSGQAGIFDEALYPKGGCGVPDESGTFYNRACNATTSDKRGGVIDEGVVTSSGYGDGGYTCEIHSNAKGMVDGVRIVFISG